ncbi:MAG: PP2C family protein-serine/threonine phosphatase [Candidatus Zhuqueibacterota bacterium]
MSSLLIIDDDKSIVYFLSEALKRESYRLSLAHGGKEALRFLKEQQFDLVVTDLQMPEVNGLDVLTAVKESSPSTEVLILTAYGSIKSAVRAMKMGAYEYLSKPVDVEELRLKVAQALEHRTMKLKIEQQQKEIDEHHAMIQRDLKLAEQVQLSLVPQVVCDDDIEISVKYLPVIGVGGDYADVYTDSKGNTYVTIIDVTGHGIAAALVVNRICSEVRNLVRDELEPSEILFYLNNFIIDTFQRTGMFLTMFASKLNHKDKLFTYAGSSHPALVLCKNATHELSHLPSQNLIIGFEKKDKNSFIQDRIRLQAGDKIVFYTDGVIDAENSNREPLGVQGLQDIISSNEKVGAENLAEVIISSMKKQKYTQVRDDVFVVVLGIR